MRPAHAACTAKGSKDESGEPRAVRESVVPEASIAALAKNSRARLRSCSKERSKRRAKGDGKGRRSKGHKKRRVKDRAQRESRRYDERGAHHERVTIAQPVRQPASQRELAIDATRRAADFTQHSPFKSPSSGGLNHDARRRVSVASPLPDTLRRDNTSTHASSRPRTWCCCCCCCCCCSLPPSSPDATFRDVQQRLIAPTTFVGISLLARVA